MVLWHTVLERQSNYVSSCIGDFVLKNNEVEAGTRQRRRRKNAQVCLATQTQISLYDVSGGTLEVLGQWPLFASVMSVGTLNLEKCDRSVLAMVTDSGNLTCLRFERDVVSGKVYMRTLCNEPFARSGIRRLAPQMQLVVDAQSRCVFLSGLERSKLCFLMDWSDDDGLVVSSALEVSRHGRIVVDTCSCDVSFDNPVLASIEIEVGTNDHYLAFYCMDLGLNSLVVKSEWILEDRSVSFVMQCPNLQHYGIRTREQKGEQDDINPFVLCGYDGYVSLRDMEGVYEVTVQLPVRKEASSTTIVNGTIHKLKKSFFMMIQSNHGDLYKVTISPDPETRNPVLEISYFDSIPTSESLHIFKTGTFLNLSEFGNSYLTQFESLGEDLAKITSYSPCKRTFIEPHASLQHLSILDSLKSLNPLTSFHVQNTTPLTLLTCSGNNINKLTSAIQFEDLISTPLPNTPSNVWAIKLKNEPFHSLLFLSMDTSTTILKIEGGTVEDFKEDPNPFKSKYSTLLVGAIGNSSIIQITSDLLIQIVKDGSKYVEKLEWLPPAGVSIVAAACNEMQLILSLSNNELCYFEIIQDSLNELQDRLELDVAVSSIGLSSGTRSNYCVLGCDDSSLKVVNLKKNDEAFFEVCSMQSLLSKPHSVAVLKKGSQLTIHVGMKNGVYMNSKLNINDGSTHDVKTKFIGSKPVEVAVLDNINVKYQDDEDEEDLDDNNRKDESGQATNDNNIQDNSNKRSFVPVVILNSSKSWITYETDNRTVLRPLSIEKKFSMKHITTFITDDVKHNGCCSITSKGILVIGKISNFLSWDKWFNGESLLLDASNENDFNTAEKEENQGEDEGDNDDYEEEKCDFFKFGKQTMIADEKDQRLCYLLSNDDNAVKLSVISDGKYMTSKMGKDQISLLNDKYIACCFCAFGTNARYLVLSTFSKKLCVIQIRVKDNSFQADIVHKTPIVENVNCLISFRDKVACILDNMIVLFSLGKKQLLKKSLSGTPPHITKAVALDQWEGNLLAIGDYQESVTIFEYDNSQKNFKCLADDKIKRHVTALKFLDSSTVIGGDKFGNCWVLRINFETQLNLVPNIHTGKYKFDTLCHIYMNDIPMQFSIVKDMNTSDRTNILWIGLQGTIGCFVPLITRKEQQIYQYLQDTFADLDLLYFQDHNKAAEIDFEEMEGALDEHKLTKNKINSTEGMMSRVGRDFQNYRSYYSPMKNIIDGEALEQYTTYLPSEQKWISKHVLLNSKTIEDVNKYINEMRTNYV